jgi:hypothetical protein
MEPGPDKHLGAPHHSESHIHVRLYLINNFNNSIFCERNVDGKPRIISKFNQTDLSYS